MTKMIEPQSPSSRLTWASDFDTFAADTHNGMAYFAGTGPKGRSCQTCGEFRAVLSRNKEGVLQRRGRCAKAKRDNGGKWMVIFPAQAKACKYHELIAENAGRAVLSANDTKEQLFVKEPLVFDEGR